MMSSLHGYRSAIQMRKCTPGMLNFVLQELDSRVDTMAALEEYDNPGYRADIYRARAIAQGIRLSLVDQGYSVEDLPIVNSDEYPCDTKWGEYKKDPLLSEKMNAWNLLLTSAKIRSRRRRKK